MQLDDKQLLLIGVGPVRASGPALAMDHFSPGRLLNHFSNTSAILRQGQHGGGSLPFVEGLTDLSGIVAH